MAYSESPGFWLRGDIWFLYPLLYLHSYLITITRKFGVCQLRPEIALMCWNQEGFVPGRMPSLKTNQFNMYID